MTEPVILLGTQSNGETLPVQVNDFGQLVAEGLTGQEGPQGPEGPEGPQGPPGPEGEGVPTPYGAEGSVLTIRDAAPAWITPAPQPPSGIIWSDFLSVQGSGASFNPSYPPHGAFDGSTSTTCIVIGHPELVVFRPEQYLGTIESLNLYTGGGSDVVYEFGFDGKTMQKTVTGNPFEFTRVIGSEWNVNSELTFKTINGGGADITIQAIELNGDFFIDSALYTTRQVDELTSRMRQLEVVMSSRIDPA